MKTENNSHYIYIYKKRMVFSMVIKMKSLALLLLFAAILVLPASAASSGVDGVDTWDPQVVDYIYVNETISKTIQYRLNTSETLDTHNWTINGTDFGEGIVIGNNYSFNYIWDNHSIGTINTIIFTGMNDSQEMEFRWYVNVYEIDGEKDTNIFSIMDNALRNHVTDLKIRMFKYHTAKNGNQPEYKARKVDQLHDEIAKKQMTKEALHKQVKEGIITQKQYVSAIKQIHKNVNENLELLSVISEVEVEPEALASEEEGAEENAHNNNKKQGKGTKNQD